MCGLVVEVLGDGNTEASIAIVGNTITDREQHLKLPLTGNSGKFLWSVCNRFGVQRNHCYVTSAVKRQLTSTFGPRGKEEISNAEAEHWYNLLRWELSTLPNLKYIVLLGKHPLRALVGHVDINHWRGTCIQDEQHRWLVIANNPADIVRSPSLEPIFGIDILKLNLVIKGQYKIPKIIAHYDPSPNEAIQWISKMHDEHKPISLDLETIGGETACFGLANDIREGMCINLRSRYDNRYSTSDERRVRMAMQRLANAADNRRVRFVVQNGAFDYGWLWFKDRIRVAKSWFDTMLAHHLLYPTLPHDLGFLTSAYTMHPYYKDELTTWREGGDISTFWEYNVKDLCITLMAQQGLLKELTDQHLDTFFFSHVMRLQPHLIEMTANGVCVDTTLKAALGKEIGKDVENARQAFYKAAQIATDDPDYTPNPGSPKQLKELFFDKLRLVGRGIKTDKANRSRMLQHPGTNDRAKAVIFALNDYAVDKKFYSTYVTSRIDGDNRARCDWKQTGTQSAPGRLSSAGTLWGTGFNLQNQPPKARPLYIAPPGYVFFYFDLAQAEARIVAFEAEIPSWQAQFEQARLDGSYDCHRALASEMFNIPYDSVPTSDQNEDGSYSIRYTAKRCRHGLNYRMMPDRLSETLKINPHEGQRLWNIYHRTTPELRVWWKALEDEVRTNKMLFNAYGRRLYIPGMLTEESLESIVAFKPQSLVGDHCTKVIYLCHDDPRWPRSARILINVHDSLTGIAKPEDVTTCLRICKQYAETPITIKGKSVILPADLSVSTPDDQGIHRWSNLKKVKGIDYVS